jgi:membrane protease YdiL (CAAX protease family)
MSEPAAEAGRLRVVTAAQLVIILAASAVLLPAISPAAVVKAGAALKLLFLVRLALLVALATWFLRLRRLRWADLGLRRPAWKRSALAIPLGLVLSVVLAAVATAIVRSTGVRPANYAMFRPICGDPGEYLFWALPVAWGSAAFGEELIFRGFVRDALERVLGAGKSYATYLSIILQAVLFGLLHLYQGPGGAANATAIGLVLGFVWLVSGRNLWAGIIIHGLIDFSAMTAIYFGMAA